jgi:predicted ATP-dependent endonuclease of OLD family
MQDIFITKIKINEVRNIKDFEINLSETERKHLIITGKNGSGKTSLLMDLKRKIEPFPSKFFAGLEVTFNYRPILISEHPLAEGFGSGGLVVAFFGAKRSSEFVKTSGAKNVEFQKYYSVEENIGNQFTQHLVNLNYDRLDAIVENDLETGNKIEKWFSEFENTLADLFDEPKLKLEFDKKNRKYQIVENGNAPINFNQLPDGYSSVLEIITELIMRMEEHKTKSYDVQGIVLIDELETHLHVDLQKKILPFLTSFFPKIQFIVTTHSPFVLQSISNAVICDLEKRIVTEDLSGYSYDTIVESYLDSDNYSDEFTDKLNEYEDLMSKGREHLSDEERDKFIDLENYLDSIPKYWAKEFAVKYQQIKLNQIGKTK